MEITAETTVGELKQRIGDEVFFLKLNKNPFRGKIIGFTFHDATLFWIIQSGHSYPLQIPDADIYLTREEAVAKGAQDE